MDIVLGQWYKLIKSRRYYKPIHFEDRVLIYTCIDEDGNRDMIPAYIINRGYRVEKSMQKMLNVRIIK